MADNMTHGDIAKDENKIKSEHKKLKEEKKLLKAQQREQNREAKKKAREIAKQESALMEESEGSIIPVILTTIIIVLLWLGILAALIKLDVGGFGSGVLRPLLQDIPVVSLILPKSEMPINKEEQSYDGYTNLADAVEQIKFLEGELEKALANQNTGQDELTSLREEVARLQTFENMQVEFERIKNEFYQEVVFAEKGPGPEEYKKYYEGMDPTTAEFIYRQVVVQIEDDKKVKDYATAYSEMKPKEAARIFEAMTDNLDLAARILKIMSAEDRGAIMGAMDSNVAAMLTKIMEPNY